MALKVNTKDLKEAMIGFNKVVENGSSVAALHYLRVEVSDNVAKITATNLSEELSYYAKCNVKEFNSFLIPIVELKKQLKSKGIGEEISIELNAGIIRVTADIAGVPITEEYVAGCFKDFPDMENMPDDVACDFSKEFFTKIKNGYKASSTDDSRKALLGVYVSTGAIVSTNGKIAFEQKIHLDIKEPIVLPKTKVLSSGTILKDDAKLSTSKGVAHFRTEKWGYVVKLVDGNFPKYENVMPTTDSKSHRIVFNNIPTLIQQIPHLKETEDNNGIFIYADKDDVLISGDIFNDEMTTSLKSKSIFTGGDPVAFGINKDYLILGLRLGLKEMIFTEITQQTTVSPLSFSKKHDRLVVMPIRFHKNQNEKVDEIITKLKGEDQMEQPKTKVKREWPINQNKATETQVAETQVAETAVEQPAETNVAEVPVEQTTEAKPEQTLTKQFPKQNVDTFTSLIEANNQMKVIAKSLLDMVVSNGKQLRESQKEIKVKEKKFIDAQKFFAASGF